MVGKVEEALISHIQKVQRACTERQALHINQLFTDSPGEYGGVAYFAVCPDNIAKELYSFLDEKLEEFWRQHGLRFRE